jgi:hypothetical protein
MELSEYLHPTQSEQGGIHLHSEREAHFVTRNSALARRSSGETPNNDLNTVSTGKTPYRTFISQSLGSSDGPARRRLDAAQQQPVKASNDKLERTGDLSSKRTRRGLIGLHLLSPIPNKLGECLASSEYLKFNHMKSSRSIYTDKLMDFDPYELQRSPLMDWDSGGSADSDYSDPDRPNPYLSATLGTVRHTATSKEVISSNQPLDLWEGVGNLPVRSYGWPYL